MTHPKYNGTYVPLSNPAVSGERVYFVAAFIPDPPVALVELRLYAIDIRAVMVERIKIAWHYDFTMSYGTIPYLGSSQVHCQGTINPQDQPIANVMFDNGVVVASINYVNNADGRCRGSGNGGCEDAPPTNSMLVSLTDKGDSYQVNFVKQGLPSFQAVAYASPNFTASRCGDRYQELSLPPAGMWVVWTTDEGYSNIEKLDIKTGHVLSKLDMDALKNIKVTSKLAIFYNDQLFQCGNSRDGGGSGRGSGDKPIMPLVFGFRSDTGSTPTSIAAVDVYSEPAELLWSVKGPLSATYSIIGQIATVGKGRDTMMAITTSKGAYFYILFAEKQKKDELIISN